MKKTYFLLSILLCYFISCSQSTINDKRVATMTQLINAIIKGDTVQVFGLVDTSFCYEINSKESFMYNINSLHTALSKEKINFNESDFLPIDTSSHDITNSYKIIFRLKNSDFDKIDMEFTFNHGVYNLVYYFNAFFRSDKDQPLDAAPSGN